MNQTQEKLAELVKEYFGIEVVSWGEREDFDATNMTIIHKDKTETVSNKGHFTVYNFMSNDSGRYKLAEWGSEFQEDPELVTFMKDAEYAAVKDYEQITPKSPTNKHSLYKLIPYTVNGEPQW